MKYPPIYLVLSVFAVGCAATAPPPVTTPSGHVLATPRNDLPGLTNFARVSDALARGAHPNLKEGGIETLRDQGIRTVVNLRHGANDDDAEGRLVRELGMCYVPMPENALTIGGSDAERFLQIVNDPANQPVFVHCTHGADRTGFVVAAYRMVDEGWSAQDAEAELPRFHFHAIFANIPHTLNRLDVEGLRERSGAPAGCARRRGVGTRALNQRGDVHLGG